MAAIKRFEDLECWKSARTLCASIFQATNSGTFAKDFSLKDQISRSSGSTMDNIADGFERGGNKESIQFLFIAKASCAEVKSQLYRATDRKHISESEFMELYNISTQTSKLIHGFIAYLSNAEHRGFKHNK